MLHGQPQWPALQDRLAEFEQAEADPAVLSFDVNTDDDVVQVASAVELVAGTVVPHLQG